MAQMNYYLQRLRHHASKNIHMSGRYHLAAGIIRSRELHHLSMNYSHFHHAETSALKKYCLLQPGRKKEKRKFAKGRSLSYPS